ncbi:hypothetical protein [Methylovorus glucosotrophus]|uniref:Uncharacterized protein n=1 Tax=Methylovorus glucosotrophus (strain SIP3-4) TaxID=582744 RepID=C6XBR3_METGS|nr:hypothetical protein [Methylovorus glucosotrophus]ACT52033.1 hypothetical protein Msip34_2796 [Methylovorus glucosotrophus SIP3-4]
MTEELMNVWDRYAAAAMNALIRARAQAEGRMDANDLCEQAAKLADFMMIERAKRGNPDAVYDEIERAIDA